MCNNPIENMARQVYDMLTRHGVPIKELYFKKDKEDIFSVNIYVLLDESYNVVEHLSYLCGLITDVNESSSGYYADVYFEEPEEKCTLFHSWN
jgi:hypothetical protein